MSSITPWKMVSGNTNLNSKQNNEKDGEENVIYLLPKMFNM